MAGKPISRRNSAFFQALLMLAAVVLIFWTVNTPAVVGASASKRELPVYCVQQDEKLVALSFDAAWGNEDTQTLIDILDQYGVNTTFFVVGDWVDRYPESVQALAEAGNEVMNHSSHHAHFSALSSSEITADISACNDKVEAITGIRPTLFRCPYGEYDDHVISAVNSLGMTAVQWDVEQSAANETPVIPTCCGFLTGSARQEIGTSARLVFVENSRGRGPVLLQLLKSCFPENGLRFAWKDFNKTSWELSACIRPSRFTISLFCSCDA